MSVMKYIDENPKRGHSQYQVKALRLSDGQTAVSQAEAVTVAWEKTNVLLTLTLQMVNSVLKGLRPIIQLETLK